MWKKLFIISMITATGLFFNACDTTETAPEGTGGLVITSSPDGATIYIDGEQKGTTPDTVFAAPGTHTMRLTLTGYEDFSTSVTFPEEGEINDAAGNPFTLTAMSGVLIKAVEAGTTTEITGASIWVNSTKLTKVTPAHVELNSGDIVVVTKDGYEDSYSRTYNGTDTELTFELTPQSVTTYTNVTIYEFSGTGNSGVDLSAGVTASAATSGTDAAILDFYFNIDNFASPSYLEPYSTADFRTTYFLMGSGTNLDDGAEWPTYSSSTWTDDLTIFDGSGNLTATNYIWVYDEDGKYSKVKITNSGGGTSSSDPLWVTLSWQYKD